MSGASRPVFWTKQRRIWSVIALVLSPLAYVLSTGPLAYLEGRGAVSSRRLEKVAFPIVFAEEHRLFGRLGVENILASYYQWWFGKGLEAQQTALQRNKS